MSETKLLPCPWCGGTDDDVSPTVESEDGHSLLYLVECINGDCGARGPWVESSPEDAIESWNTRTDPRIAAADAMAKALKGLDNCVMREGLERTEDPDEKRSAGAFIALMDALRVARTALAAWEKLK